MDSLDIQSVDSLSGLITILINSMVVMPEIALLFAVSGILVVSLFAGRKSELFTYGLSLLTLVGVIFLIQRGFSRPDVSLFSEMYVYDGLAKFLKLLVCITVAVIFIYARPYLIHHKQSQPEFYILGLFATLGMLVMISAQNFLTYLFRAGAIVSLSLCLSCIFS